MNSSLTHKDYAKQSGFSLPELVIVLLILAVLIVLALPQINASRRAFRFTSMQRQVASTLNETRQEAMAQRTPITVRYDDTSKKFIVHGGKFGAFGDAGNRSIELSGSGLETGDIAYGRPSGAPTDALADTSNMTPLTADAASIVFQPDGSVVDAANNPQNNALFFCHRTHPNEMAFAVSVLGAGGRIKVWRYNQSTNVYVE